MKKRIGAGRACTQGSDPAAPSRVWIRKGGDGRGHFFKNITRMRGSFVYQSGDMILHGAGAHPLHVTCEHTLH